MDPQSSGEASPQRNRSRNALALTGALVALAAVIAVIVLLVVRPGAGPTAVPTEGPAPTATATPTSTTPAPTVTTPTATPASPVTSAHLLTVGLLEAAEPEPAGWRQLEQPGTARPCAPAAGGTGAVNTFRRSFVTPDGSRLDQVVTVFRGTESAHDAFTAMRQRIITCPKSKGGKLDAGWRLDQVGDEAFLAEFVIPDPDPENDLVVQARLARTGVAVTSVFTGGLQNEWGHAPVDWRKLAIAVERLCSPAGGECVGSPVRVRVLPQPVSAAGFLQVSDMPDIPGNEWVAYDVIEAAERPDVETVCDVGTLESLDPVRVQSRHYAGIVGDDPLAAGVSQMVARFASESAAVTYTKRHAAAYADCGEAAEAPRRVSVSVPGATISAWAMDFIDVFVGAVEVHDRVTVVMTDSTAGDITEAEFKGLLGRAVARLK